MGFFSKYILPSAIRLSCGAKPIRLQRMKVVPWARGVVLEVGIGSGLNLPYYDPARVEKLWAVDPSVELRRFAEREARRVPFPVEFIGETGEQIPLEENSIDTVVVTYTLCTIPGVLKALREMRRVLKPDGALLFSEHGQAPDDNVRRWQDRLNPIWSRISGGCNLNRPIPSLITGAGFRITRLENRYLPGPRPMTYNFWGSAESGP